MKHTFLFYCFMQIKFNERREKDNEKNWCEIEWDGSESWSNFYNLQSKQRLFYE